MSQKMYLWILRIGTIASFICVWIIFKNLLFPFISSKQIAFNVLTEVLFVFWLAFIIKFPQWNPFGKFAGQKTKNLVTYGLGAFFAALVASLFVTVDFNLSMWGDVERMLGVFHILHFGILYLVIITVFRDRNDWRMLIGAALVSAVGVAMLGTNDSKSTIGNNAYTAALMMFASWFVFILMLQSHQAKHKENLTKWLYLLPLPLLLFVLKKTDTSGAFVGTALGLATFVFIFGITNKIKKFRIAAWAVLALGVGFLVLYYVNINNPSFPKISILNSISLQKNTFQTRLISWRGAWEDFKNHPILGVGHGNYAVIFDKYFDPKFYDYSRGETYFDRAHNNLVDIASTTGLVGLLTYLSIFVFVAIYLIKAFRRGRIGGVEFALWSSLYVAYFVQNLVVFDSFVTYLCLMVVLGYVHWLANTNESNGNSQALISKGGEASLINKEIYTLAATGLIMLFVVFQYNISVFNMLSGVIAGQQAIGSGKFVSGYEIYKKAFSKNTVLDRDGRSMFLRSYSGRPSDLARLNQSDIDNITAYAIELAEMNVKYNPGDSMMQMELARTYDTASRLTKDNSKSSLYANKALSALEESIKASPRRIPLYFIKAQFLVGLGRIDEAIASLENVAPLNEKFFETYCQLGQIYLIKGNVKGTPDSEKPAFQEKGYEALDRCLANGGGDMLAVESVIAQAINHYSEKQDIDKVVQLYEQLVNFRQKDATVWKNLALLYAQTGELEKAQSAADNAAKIDPSLRADVDAFIKQLKNR
jgi:tetratricopeptide (TPR) repeat protein